MWKGCQQSLNLYIPRLTNVNDLTKILYPESYKIDTKLKPHNSLTSAFSIQEMVKFAEVPALRLDLFLFEFLCDLKI